MTDTVFTTPRLSVRRWRPTDIDDLFGVYADAKAMRWGQTILPLTQNKWQNEPNPDTANTILKYGWSPTESRTYPGNVCVRFR